MPFIDLYDHPEDVGRLVVAAQRAIVKTFSEADWTELAFETGTQDYLLNHRRLIRSLNWGDKDYQACVYEVLRFFSEERINAFEALVRHPSILPDIQMSVSDVLGRIGINSDFVSAVNTQGLSAPDVVLRALADADSLLEASGPISVIDRLHTAFQGYLRSVSLRDGLEPDDGASITSLLKLLRKEHPVFQNFEGRDRDAGRVLNGFASVLDALNSIRNNASVAHPNEILIGEAEAHLLVNATRTMFHYIRTKVEN